VCSYHCAVYVLKKRSRLLQKRCTCRRQQHPTTVALKKSEADLLLQRSDLTAHSRLCNVHSSRGAAKMEFFSNCDEVAKMTQLHDA